MTDPSPESLDVSRETFERLETYVALLRKWSPRINLVSGTTLENAWERHIRDSLQVLRAAENPTGHWVDLGTGGGFPGLVVALCQPPNTQVTLVESDTRKATFLRTVLRETGTEAQVIAQRIEQAPPQAANILSARALAPLPKLLEFAERHLDPGGTALLPKGITWKNEIAAAQNSFSFEWDSITSETQNGAVILRIGAISRV